MTRFRESIAPFQTHIGMKTLPLGMGGAYVGAPADTAMLKGFQATLEQAYAAGMRYFDTSAQYGGSEFRFGTFLRTVPRDSVFIATKSPIPAALTAQEAALFIRQAIRNSQERLGVETIDLFQIHDVETLEQVLPSGGVVDTLLEAREAGSIRYFGLATRFHDLLETAVLHGEFDTILTYADYTPINSTAGDLIALAATRGLGIINGSPLAFGLLTGQDPRTNAYLNGEWRLLRRRASQLFDFCQQRAVPLLAVAMQYPFQNPDINITLTGAASPEELQKTLTACQTELPLDFWHELHAELGVPLPFVTVNS